MLYLRTLVSTLLQQNLDMVKKYAIDCEMVGSGNKSILARVSIVDYYGRVVVDTFVKPTDVVTDYRVFITGITWKDLENGVNINIVRDKVRNLFRGCILVGHSLHFDLAALYLQHPKAYRRDLANYEPFTWTNGGQPVSLKKLARKYLGEEIQTGQHCSVEDARASMEIYKVVESNWEGKIESDRIKEELERAYLYESEDVYPVYPIVQNTTNNQESSSSSFFFKLVVTVGLFALIYSIPKSA